VAERTRGQTEEQAQAAQLPAQRWQIAPEQAGPIRQLAAATGLPPLLAQVLIQRGIDTPEAALAYLDPERMVLPSPHSAFQGLASSVARLKSAIASGEKIAICGDYDADGMTSTALLLRALRHLGARVDYAVPSRLQEGYGINTRIVDELAQAGTGVVLTVDNGIAAYEPIARAAALGMSAIVTDHHELPAQLPPAEAILNPKLAPADSPYRGVAGVGVAYILAVTLARDLGQLRGLTAPLLELFALGTIADMAPLVGVNRRWLKRGLRLLPQSRLPGVQALMRVANLPQRPQALRPDDIGFRLGPRINAVGRIAEPQVAIELLATDDRQVAWQRAQQCEQANQRRRALCTEIERAAIAGIERAAIDWARERVLVLVQPEWHPGVIGIVASRLVERYGVPVFLGTYADADRQQVRGSARGIPEFHVFQALQACQELLDTYGGHQAAGGFALPSANLDAFRQRLRAFAHRCLSPEQLQPLVRIDGRAQLHQLGPEFYRQLEALQPWGMGNAEPVFWTPRVRVLEQRIVGGEHLKLALAQSGGDASEAIAAIAWRWREYFPLPSPIDVAYKLRQSDWDGNLELELVGARPPSADPDGTG